MKHLKAGMIIIFFFFWKDRSEIKNGLKIAGNFQVSAATEAGVAVSPYRASRDGGTDRAGRTVLIRHMDAPQQLAVP